MRLFSRLFYKPKYLNTAIEPRKLSAWWLLLLLWLASAIPELVLHIATAREHALFNSGMLLSVLFAIVPAGIVFAIISLIPVKGVNLGITIAYSVLYALLAGSQLVYYKIFGVYYTAFSLANGGQALMDFWGTAVNTIFDNIFLVLLLLIPPLGFSILAWRIIDFRGLRSWKLGAATLAGSLVLQLLLVFSLPLFGGTSEMTAYDLYHNTTNTYYGINKLGLLTGFRIDLSRYFQEDEEPEGTLNLDVTKPTFNFPFMTNPAPNPTTQTPTTNTNPGTNPGTVPGTTGTVPTPTEPQPTVPPLDTSPNILDIDFDSLINSTSNKTLKQMHQYFKSKEPSNKNEYTGIFEGCNLILICAEGFSSLIIDEQRTPTLYKMMTEGIYLDNYYVPTWGVSTTDGEYAFLTGTIPKAGVWSFYKSIGNAMPLTMSKQLLKEGYNAYAYHGHTYTYYHRNEYLENLGFQYKGVVKDKNDPTPGLDINYKIWPESDIEVVDVSTPEFVTQEPFITYYMSISGHLEYTFNDNYIAYKNRNDVKNEPYCSNVRAYLACQLEFERSMELLLKRLEEAGTLENTVIVITADHDPYGLTDAEYSELFGHDIETNFERYKNGAIIYKPGIEPKVVTKLSSHLDLLPTLSNMFGLDFDSRLYMGSDVFSDAEPLVMFENRSWITNYACYNASTKTYSSLIGEEIPQEYYDYIKSEVSNRFTISKWILETDYWKVLFPNG